MPQAPAGARIERQQAVGEQVVAGAIAAVNVIRRGAGGKIRDAALLVERNIAPIC
jgi:hypothetical protein